MSEHERQPGHLAAWRELNRKLAAELAEHGEAGVGPVKIKPAKWFRKMADPAKVHTGLFAARVLRARFGRHK